MLLCVSVSHRSADFALLDRLSAATADARAVELAPGLADGAVLLTTCNRIEAYLDVRPGGDSAAAEHAVRGLARAAGVDVERMRASAAVRTGDGALRHLFAVTAGLESLAVGEDEIAGQVKRAYDAARTDGVTTPELDTAFQRASRVSREIRTMTELGRAGRSLVQLALELAGSRIADWRTTPVLVVGTGNYAATTIASLRELGVTHLDIYSATGRAERFAARYGLRARQDLAEAIADARIVITCTARYVLTAEHLAAGARLLVDLGLPRNVDPAVAEVPGVELLDLELIARHAAVPARATAGSARELVESAADRFVAEQSAAPAVVALRRHVFDAMEAEIARAEARASTPEEARLAAASLRHLAGVLLHEPSQRARSAAARGRIVDFEMAMSEVFGIDAHAADAPAPVVGIDAVARREPPAAASSAS